MTTKTVSAAPSTTVGLVPGLRMGLWQTAPRTTEDRLQSIEAMGQRITGYVQFMCQMGNHGTSVEAKDKAVTEFYEHLSILERQLSRIQEGFQLE